MVDPAVKRVADWVAQVIWYSILGAASAVVGVVFWAVWDWYAGR